VRGERCALCVASDASPVLVGNDTRCVAPAAHARLCNPLGIVAPKNGGRLKPNESKLSSQVPCVFYCFRAKMFPR